MVEVTNAAWAVDGTVNDQGLHFLGTVTPVYFHVPKGTIDFHLSLQATPPGETAVATLFAPDGQAVVEFDCTSLLGRSQEDLRPAFEFRMVETPDQTGTQRGPRRCVGQAGQRTERLFFTGTCSGT